MDAPPARTARPARIVGVSIAALAAASAALGGDHEAFGLGTTLAWCFGVAIVAFGASTAQRLWDTPRATKYVVRGAAAWAVVAALIIHFGPLDSGIFYDDEVAYQLQARILATGHVSLDGVETADYYALPFLLNRTDGFTGAFPPGWPAVLSIGSAAGVPWLVAPLLAGLVVLLLARLASRLAADPARGRRAACFTALLVGTCPWLAVQAGSSFSHVLSLALTAGAANLVLGSRHRAALALGGAVVGLLTLTRPLNGLVVALVLGVDLLRRRQVGQLARFATFVGLGAATLVAYNLEVNGAPMTFGATTYLDAVEPLLSCHRLGFGEDVGCPLNHGEEWPGYTPVDAVETTWTRLQGAMSSPYGGPLALLPLLLLIGAAPGHRGGAVLGALAGLTVAAYGLFYFRAEALGTRLLFELLVLAPLGGLALAWATGSGRARWPRVAAALALGGLVAGPWAVIRDVRPWGIPDVDFGPARRIVAAAEEHPETAVLLDNMTLMKQALNQLPLPGRRGGPLVLFDPARDHGTLALLLPGRTLSRWIAATASLEPAAPDAGMLSVPLLSRWPFWDRSADPCTVDLETRGAMVRCDFDAPTDHLGFRQAFPEGCWQVGLHVRLLPSGAALRLEVDEVEVGVPVSTRGPGGMAWRGLGPLRTTQGAHRVTLRAVTPGPVSLGRLAFKPDPSCQR